MLQQKLEVDFAEDLEAVMREDLAQNWMKFLLYRTHENPISLVGKFELGIIGIYDQFNCALDAVKAFLNNTQLRVKYSLETIEFHSSVNPCIKQYLNRRCVLHETNSYDLVIEMAYDVETDISSINVSDLDQPPCDRMKAISFCVRSL
uniref:Uncharacterized protein n=1 Tax=Acrobeloides nanus TaxID=290746 RepID=A0A914DQI1_9BILA